MVHQRILQSVKPCRMKMVKKDLPDHNLNYPGQRQRVVAARKNAIPIILFEDFFMHRFLIIFVNKERCIQLSKAMISSRYSQTKLRHSLPFLYVVHMLIYQDEECVGSKTAMYLMSWFLD